MSSIVRSKLKITLKLSFPVLSPLDNLHPHHNLQSIVCLSHLNKCGKSANSLSIVAAVMLITKPLFRGAVGPLHLLPTWARVVKF